MSNYVFKEYSRIKVDMNAYLVSHNGLGDNLFMIGALRFLLNFYDKIFFLCKNKYYKDVVTFFEDSNIICVVFDENDEFNAISNIIKINYNMNDILVCGPCHKSYLTSKITNEKFLKYIPINKEYTIDFDTLISSEYSFIEGFYKDLNLNLTYFYDYFYIPSTKESLEYYNNVKNYYIVFIQWSCSDGRKLNISKLLEKYLHDTNVILVSNDVNFYDIPNKTEDNKIKYNICNKILHNSRIINYKDIILNSDEIYIIDSCFTGIVLPYLKTNQLKTNKVRIIHRNLVDSIEL